MTYLNGAHIPQEFNSISLYQEYRVTASAVAKASVLSIHGSNNLLDLVISTFRFLELRGRNDKSTYMSLRQLYYRSVQR